MIRIPTEYRPDAYVFVYSQDDFQNRYAQFYTTPAEVAEWSKVKFDFDRYSYLIVHGRNAHGLTYSIKATYFDDESPYYCSALRGLKYFATIEYGDEYTPYSVVYKIEKGIPLAGFGI